MSSGQYTPLAGKRTGTVPPPSSSSTEVMVQKDRPNPKLTGRIMIAIIVTFLLSIAVLTTTNIYIILGLHGLPVLRAVPLYIISLWFLIQTIIISTRKYRTGIWGSLALFIAYILYGTADLFFGLNSSNTTLFVLGAVFFAAGHLFQMLSILGFKSIINTKACYTTSTEYLRIFVGTMSTLCSIGIIIYTTFETVKLTGTLITVAVFLIHVELGLIAILGLMFSNSALRMLLYVTGAHLIQVALTLMIVIGTLYPLLQILVYWGGLMFLAWAAAIVCLSPLIAGMQVDPCGISICG
jgi:hypothetical protein